MTSQGPMAKAVADALRIAQPEPRDSGAVGLVRQYARLLDAVRGTEEEAETYDKLGPKLLAALTALGLTVAGRAAKGGVTDASSGTSKLDELRARRAARSN